MFKGLIYLIFGILFLGILFLFFNMKNAYKVIPVTTSSEMKVPSFAAWREFVSKSNQFKVLLPAPPQYAKESVPIPNTNKFRRYEMYASEKTDGAVFMISLITYPKDMVTDSFEMLHEIVQEMVTEKPNNSLEKNQDTFFEGFPAVDFTVLNKKYKVEGKTFLEESTIYLLTYVAPIENFNLEEYRHFIDSFHLLENLKQPNNK